MESTIRRPLDLSARQWAALEQIADALGAREPHGRGHNVRVTKWQLVIRGIASGQYVVTEREPYRLPVGLAEAAAAVEERRQEYERILEEQRRRITEQAMPPPAAPVKLETTQHT